MVSLLRDTAWTAVCPGMATKIGQEVRQGKWPIRGLGMDMKTSVAWLKTMTL